MKTPSAPAQPVPTSTPNPANQLETSQKEVVTAPSSPQALDTVKVRFKHGHPALAYSIGEEADLPRELYEQYVGENEYFEAI